ncbi:MAG: GNAT family N-acetyltransferase [Chloroflexota bacterium]|nr:GNAT family N-acetyltransferase [Chloroflexota bacterium]MDE2885861.1 GNAT family N-acetyltransferase [Chloroflexota bacterium]
MEGVTLRAAQASDAAGITDLVAALARERGGTTDADAVVAAVEECIGDPGHEIIIAAAGEEAVAYVAVHWVPFPMLGGREGYVSDLIVRADWRGHGLGNRLMEAAELRAREMGCARLMLNNRVAAESFERGFFTKAGFRQRTDFANFVKTLGTV